MLPAASRPSSGPDTLSGDRDAASEGEERHHRFGPHLEYRRRMLSKLPSSPASDPDVQRAERRARNELKLIKHGAREGLEDDANAILAGRRIMDQKRIEALATAPGIKFRSRRLEIARRIAKRRERQGQRSIEIGRLEALIRWRGSRLPRARKVNGGAQVLRQRRGCEAQRSRESRPQARAHRSRSAASASSSRSDPDESDADNPARSLGPAPGWGFELHQGLTRHLEPAERLERFFALPESAQRAAWKRLGIEARARAEASR